MLGFALRVIARGHPHRNRVDIVGSIEVDRRWVGTVGLGEHLPLPVVVEVHRVGPFGPDDPLTEPIVLVASGRTISA